MKQRWCWTSDTVPSGGAFYVFFDVGGVNWDYPNIRDNYVRGIRPGQ